MDRIGGFEPAAHTHTGGEHHDVGPALDQLHRRVAQLVFLAERMGLDGGSVEAGRAAAGEELDLLFRSSVGGDAHDEAGERCAVTHRLPFGHAP